MTSRWLFALFFLPLVAWAGADEDWAYIESLEAGPQTKMETREVARVATLQHLGVQEKAYRAFIVSYPSDPRRIDAEFRLIHTLSVKADFSGDPKLASAARGLAAEIESRKGATPEQQATAAFLGVSLAMRGAGEKRRPDRETTLSLIRKFQAKYPSDRRVPRLLVSVAGMCDGVPVRKKSLLDEARSLTSEPTLQAEIDDGLRQIGLLGAPLPVAFQSIDGTPIDLANYHGRVVLLFFFADWSPPSMQRVGEIVTAANAIGTSKLQVVGISLDERREVLDGNRARMPEGWVIGWEPDGWKGKNVRALGLNVLPTVWLLDGEGRLRTLNLREDPVPAIRSLLR